MPSKLSRWLPFLNWPRPDAALLRGEVAAALTVAVVMIPQSVAYAGLAGMPLVTGLYATFLPALLAVLFSSSTRLSVGPSALSSVLVGASLVGLAEPGSAQWVALAVWLALLAGMLQLAVGASGAAWVLNLVSSPVLTGFSQAAAFLIIASQLPALLGLQGPLSGLLEAPRFDLEALGYGLGALALFELGKRRLPRLPMVLLVLAAAAALSAITGYAARGAVVGALPVGLPSPYWPGLPGWERFLALVAPALVIALVSSLEMAASAKIEAQRDGRRWDANQDLIGQGVGKLASAFSGSFPTSTSFSRSAITLYAGARTGWATVATTALVLLVLLFLTPALYHVPSAVLAAVVVAAVLGLVKPRSLLGLWRIQPMEAVTAGVTFAVTLLSAPRIYWGVLAGVVLGLAHFLYHRLHPRIIEVGLHPDGSLRDRHLWKLAPLADRMYALRMDDELDFASASAFERAIVDHLAAHPDVQHVCLFAQPINRIDATGVEVFTQLRKTLEARGITLHISGLKLPVEQVLRRAGALHDSPLLRMYRTDVEALLAFGRLSP
ncbi:SulP family inorganic anion transporter [Ramlibacter tataouinensis]|uniref:Candidate sulfate permease n=1 Tax=Ramlibacter tataouinensis (strain ATCC BAA-407 / DSM 14655 / LMG 21543 / TTB310) TaxID=365046 RepID=F5XWR6_RAMTT|nr:SulP family inorganic anion transporter [Ramlibacter tataouinensis]AEG94210.1 Candidate sulfate permease [Ramlibacter tataouinensis TTB310]